MTSIPKRNSHDGSVTIAVMGTTGTGKSSFINLVSGSNFNVGHGLRSCTAAVTMAKPVLIDGVAINLIDTPGFDDTVVNDVDILKMISVYLASTFEHGIKLSGIIYLHRISDQRLGGISRRCFSLFKKLCGEKTMKNVFITTTMWDLISEEIGASREKELTIDDLLFKPALDHGAQMCRHDGAKESAISIIREIMENRHKALSIQKELVIEGKDITQTGAAKELICQHDEFVRKQSKELADMKEQIEEALLEKDRQTEEELQATKRALEEKLAAIEEKRRDMSEAYYKEKIEVDKIISGLATELRLPMNHGIEKGHYPGEGLCDNGNICPRDDDSDDWTDVDDTVVEPTGSYASISDIEVTSEEMPYYSVGDEEQRPQKLGEMTGILADLRRQMQLLEGAVGDQRSQSHELDELRRIRGWQKELKAKCLEVLLSQQNRGNEETQSEVDEDVATLREELKRMKREVSTLSRRGSLGRRMTRAFKVLTGKE